jgi:hypothetical protein
MKILALRNHAGLPGSIPETVEHFSFGLILPVSLPGSIGRSGIHDQCLLHRPVKRGDTLSSARATRTPASCFRRRKKYNVPGVLCNAESGSPNGFQPCPRQNVVPAIHALLVMLSKNDARMTRSMISICRRRPHERYFVTSVVRQTHADDFEQNEIPLFMQAKSVPCRGVSGLPSIIAVRRQCRDDLLAA